MTIVRYEPWSLVDRLTRQFETARTVAWIPSVDVHEEAQRYVVRADLPGVSPDDIEITAEAGVLTIKGERKAGTQQTEANNYQRVERVAGNFVRRFTLPEAAQTDAIKATHVNGVLELSIPKQVKPEPRRIKVEAA
jgi:HSP20 family protein